MSAKEGEDEEMVKSGSKVDYRSEKKSWFVTNKRKALVIFLILFILVLVICVLIAVSASKSPPPEEVSGPQPWHNVRLPDYIRPVHYDMTIDTNFTSSTYTGESFIEIDVTKATEYILIHMKLMTIDSTRVLDSSQTKEFEIKKTFYFKYNQFWVIQMKEKLDPGTYVLHLTFSAKLDTVLSGYYLSTYRDKNGNIKKLSATDFEPTDARKAFPCFDEPAMKAEFTIHLIHDKEHHGLSNMPEVSKVDNGNTFTTNFNRSVPMSTYLVAFIVSDFESKSKISKTAKKTRVGVWSIPYKVDTTTYALEKGVDMLEFLEKFYDVEYSLSKEDMIALPDFGAGAMENWGLITYRETYMLFEEGVNPVTSQQGVTTVIAHELAHQWFGNIVSPAWWDDLWLNEGFASFMEYYAVNSTEPSWQMMEQFVVLDLFRVMPMDSSVVTSHPIIMSLERPENIMSIFDRISYSKGSAILMMLEDFMGSKDFQAGLTHYLRKFHFKNARSKDLWEALSEKSTRRKDIAAVMDTWTLQMGFPVVTIRNNGTVTQKHFLLDPDAKVNRKSPYNYLWHVPLTYYTDKDMNPTREWMDMKSISISLPNDRKWVKGNYNQRGYYRVNYDSDNWKELGKQLKTAHKVFKTADRAGLLDDSFSFARAAILDYEYPLDMTMYLRKEEDYVPWRQAIRNIGYIRSLLRLREAYGKYKDHILYLLEPNVKRLTLAENPLDSHLTKLLRIIIMRYACFLGKESCNTQAKKLFEDWKNNGKDVNPNIRSIVYYSGVANGNADDWEFVLKKMETETDAAEKRLLRTALAGTKELWLLSRYLRYSLDQTKVRLQDTPTIISMVSSNIYGGELAWSFFKQNYEELLKRYTGRSNYYIRSIITSTTFRFSSKAKLTEVTEFFDALPVFNSSAKAIDQSKESIRDNIEWLEKYEGKVSAWLNKQPHLQ